MTANILNFLALTFYRFLIMPTVVVLLPFAALFNKKIAAGMKLRRQLAEGRPGEDPIWIHASSGEFEYAKAVIRELKSRRPDLPIVVTYFSPTFAKAAASFEGVSEAVALPLDLAGPCRSFLRKVHPRALLIARTDLWPEMLEQCRKIDLPVILFSCTQKTLHSRLKAAIQAWTLHWITQIYCVSPKDFDNLKGLGLTQPVSAMGDTRYDQVAYRLTHGQPLPPALQPSQDLPCLVAGSTWPEDEAVLLPALAAALKARRMKLIVVPHEPTPSHIKELSDQIEKLGLKHALFSALSEWHEAEVLVVDKVGVLAELYHWADLAFVGGSFRKTVHSVMEALGAGALTFVGPLHENNREASEFSQIKLGRWNGVEVVENQDAWRAKLQEVLSDPASVAEHSRKLKEEFTGRMGASRRLVDDLAPLLKL